MEPATSAATAVDQSQIDQNMSQTVPNVNANEYVLPVPDTQASTMPQAAQQLNNKLPLDWGEEPSEVPTTSIRDTLAVFANQGQGQSQGQYYDQSQGQILTIEPYNEKSFKVVGKSKPYQPYLSDLNGKWNTRLVGGAGWIFSNKHQEEVAKFVQDVNTGLINPVNYTPKQNNYKNKKNFGGYNQNNQNNHGGYNQNRTGYNQNRTGYNTGGITLPNQPRQYGNPKIQQFVIDVFAPAVGDVITIQEGSAQASYSVISVNPDQYGKIGEANFDAGGRSILMLVTFKGWQVAGKYEPHYITLR